TERQVLKLSQKLDQLKTLVHHTDPMLDRMGGRRDGDALPVQLDTARGRLDQAVDGAHQRGLSRAVFAHDRVDSAARNLQVDAVVRQDRSVCLAQAADPNPGFGHEVNQGGLPCVIVFHTLIWPLMIFCWSALTLSRYLLGTSLFVNFMGLRPTAPSFKPR